MIEKALIQNFYRISLFGNEPDSVTAAAKRAYRDFCRTINFKKKSDHSRAVEKVVSIFRVWLLKISEIQSVEGYDKWHKELYGEIKKAFDEYATLTVGQVQKWINMTMKYLIILEEKPEKDITQFLHVPIDSIILKKSGKANFFGQIPWSRIDSYSDYMEFQKELRKDYETPIEWEFQAWNDADEKQVVSKKQGQFEKYNYYNGETQNPFEPDSTNGRFWHGEMMYDQLQDKEYYTQEAKKWRKELEELWPGCTILLYDDVTLGIILYTDCIFGKFSPYGNSKWIFEYKTKPKAEKPAFYKRLSPHGKKVYEAHVKDTPLTDRFIELMNQKEKSVGADEYMFYTDEEREYLAKEHLVLLYELHPEDADYYMMCD